MFRVFVELFDFIFKAIAFYVRTPEGQKEWSDINRAAGVAQEGSVQRDTDPISAQAADNRDSAARRARRSN